MSTRIPIVSSDCHIGLALPAHKEYLESKYHAKLDDYIAMVSAMFEKRATQRATVRKYMTREKSERMRAFSDQVSRDNDRRIKELESDNVVGEVLFADGASVPFVGVFGMAEAIEGESLELALAGQRSHNRWLADFVDPSRQVGAALLNYADVAAAVRDVYWAAEAGLRTVCLNAIQTNVPPPWDHAFTPLWDAVEETGLPISIHAGAGTPPPSNAFTVGTGVDTLASFGALQWAVNITEAGFSSHRPLWFFIWGGVLERHPRMKLVFTEQGSGWIANAVRYMDWQWEYGPHSEDTLLPRRPSEYWAEQCFVGSSIMTHYEVAHRAEIGVANMMFGTDFPHAEGTFGKTVAYLNYILAGAHVSERELRALVGENAVRCYDLDLAHLQSIADVVGPTVDDILSPSAEPVDDPETVMWADKPSFLF
jgi:predicted TIM-barrel fold metal-dependent hydrolase